MSDSPQRRDKKQLERDDRATRASFRIEDEIRAQLPSEHTETKTVQHTENSETTGIYIEKKNISSRNRDYPEHPDRKSKTIPGYGLGLWYYQAEAVGGPISYRPGRNTFVLAVFSLCAVMLAFTLTYIIFTHGSKCFRRFTSSVAGLFTFVLTMIGTMMVSYIYCCSSCSRIAPINFFLNIITVCCYSYICGYIASKYAPYIVIGATGTTFIVTLFCMCQALTSLDFTRFLLIVMVAMVALMAAIVIVITLNVALGIKLTALRVVLLLLTSVFSSVMLVIQMQMILGGKSVEIGEEEYTFGAFMVYTSIITIFLTFMRILGIIYDRGGFKVEYSSVSPN